MIENYPALPGFELALLATCFIFFREQIAVCVCEQDPQVLQCDEGQDGVGCGQGRALLSGRAQVRSEKVPRPHSVYVSTIASLK